MALRCRQPRRDTRTQALRGRRRWPAWPRASRRRPSRLPSASLPSRELQCFLIFLTSLCAAAFRAAARPRERIAQSCTNKQGGPCSDGVKEYSHFVHARRDVLQRFPARDHDGLACRAIETPVAAARAFAFMTPGSALDAAPAATPPSIGGGDENAGGGVANASAAVLPRVENAGAVGGAIPIEALNPYRGKWTIVAKVDSKAPLKRVDFKGSAGAQAALLTVVLVDAKVRLQPRLQPRR